MPPPAGGFPVFCEGSPSQSEASLSSFVDSAVADRSGSQETRCICAPGTWMAEAFAHGPAGAAAAGLTHAATSSGTRGISSSRFRADIVVLFREAAGIGTGQRAGPPEVTLRGQRRRVRLAPDRRVRRGARQSLAGDVADRAWTDRVTAGPATQRT